MERETLGIITLLFFYVIEELQGYLHLFVINGDRREQRAIREKERLSLEWPKIIGAIATVWKEPWEVISVQRGNGALGLAYYLGQRHAGITLRELGRHVGEVEYPAVSLGHHEI